MAGCQSALSVATKGIQVNPADSGTNRNGDSPRRTSNTEKAHASVFVIGFARGRRANKRNPAMAPRRSDGAGCLSAIKNGAGIARIDRPSNATDRRIPAAVISKPSVNQTATADTKGTSEKAGECANTESLRCSSYWLSLKKKGKRSHAAQQKA